MCATYTLEASRSTIIHEFGLIDIPFEKISKRFVPYTQAPVIVATKGPMTNYHVETMNFSMVPSWSSEPKIKFATHNARVETVLEKKTWKGPFVKRHCLVPISSFIEPIYTGKFAGNMVAFREHRNELLYAAGIWDEWINKSTGEVIRSFAIVTQEPYSFIEKAGHDRSPIFLMENQRKAWLSPGYTDEQLSMNILTKLKPDYHFRAEIDRPMRPGWEKQIPKE